MKKLLPSKSLPGFLVCTLSVRYHPILLIRRRFPCLALLSVGFRQAVRDSGGAQPQSCSEKNSVTRVSCLHQSNTHDVTGSPGAPRTLEPVSLIIVKPRPHVPFSKKVWERGIL